MFASNKIKPQSILAPGRTQKTTGKDVSSLYIAWLGCERHLCGHIKVHSGHTGSDHLTCSCRDRLRSARSLLVNMIVKDKRRESWPGRDASILVCFFITVTKYLKLSDL